MNTLTKLTRPTPVEDLYSVDCGWFVPTGADFDFPEKGDRVLTLTKQLKKKLQTLCKFSGNQDVRYYLNGLKFGHDLIIGCDGRRLLQTANDTGLVPTDSQDLIIPLVFLKQLFRLPVWDNGKLFVINGCSNALRIDLDDGSLVANTIDGKFPDTKRIWGNKASPMGTFTLDKPLVKELKEHAKLEKIINSKGFDKYQGIRLNGNIEFPSGKWFDYASTGDNNQDFKTGVNFTYLLDFPVGGEFTVKDEPAIGKQKYIQNSVQYDNGEFQGLLMPMRL